MPLKMTVRGKHRDKMGPAIVCDHCGEQIKPARDGNVQWNMDQKEPERDIFFTHKRCYDAFSGRGLWATNDLDSLPISLAANLEMEIETTEAEPPMVGYVLRGEVLDL